MYGGGVVGGYRVGVVGGGGVVDGRVGGTYPPVLNIGEYNSSQRKRNSSVVGIVIAKKGIYFCRHLKYSLCFGLCSFIRHLKISRPHGANHQGQKVHF